MLGRWFFFLFRHLFFVKGLFSYVVVVVVVAAAAAAAYEFPPQMTSVPFGDHNHVLS
jgi:hypothetical protein